MSSLEWLTKDSKELQTDSRAIKPASTSFIIPLIRSVITFFGEHVEGGDNFLFEDADFFSNKAQEHRG